MEGLCDEKVVVYSVEQPSFHNGDLGHLKEEGKRARCAREEKHFALKRPN